MLAMLVGLVGAALIVAGLALIYPPAAFIAAGAAVVRLAMLLEGGDAP